MKKIGLGLIGLLLAGAIYYFTAGSAQLTQELKKQVDTELTAIQKDGFSVQERNIEEKKEHFIISFDDTKKISHFLFRQGVQMNESDAEVLKGLKIGVDVNYLADTYSAVTFDMYPVALPELLTPDASTKEDKQVLAQIKTLLEKKTMLVHLAINKLGSGFKGYMKDIDEVIQGGEKEVKLALKKLTFSGDIEDGKLKSVKQNLEKMSINMLKEISFSVRDISSDYVITGKTAYDYKTHYNIKNILAEIDTETKVKIENFDVVSSSVVNDKNIGSGTMRTTIDHIDFVNLNNNETYNLKAFIVDMKVDNFDMGALEKIQKIDVNDEEAMMGIMQEFFAKGVKVAIPTLSLKSIEKNGENLGGIHLDTQVTFDKSFDFTALESNPMSLISSVDADLNLKLSKEIFSIIMQQPQAMMALMVVQPKDVNGQKVFELQLKDGKLSVNGMPMM